MSRRHRNATSQLDRDALRRLNHLPGQNMHLGLGYELHRKSHHQSGRDGASAISDWRGNTATTEGRFFTVSGIPTPADLHQLVEQILDVGGRMWRPLPQRAVAQNRAYLVVGHARER